MQVGDSGRWDVERSKRVERVAPLQGGRSYVSNGTRHANSSGSTPISLNGLPHSL